MQAYPSGANPILQALRGKISVRQLRVMVENLPRDNAAQRELEGPWLDEAYLLHDIDTQLRSLIALTYNVNKSKGTAPISPKPLPTPETLDRDTDHRSEDQIAAEQNHLLSVLNRSNPT